ncbi:MAG: SGNH hydrolase domain-containing protein, partial [Phycisphaerae bacterium]
LDPKEYLLDAQQRCRVVRDGKALYFDTNHLTVTGTDLLRPMFVPIFTGATTPATTQVTPGS